ncbi:MAG: hypothetical protein IPM12_14600 [Flavobacteriales bacterium]|nr:hypothetical protein [Flavobacteriales bacterium]
MRSPILAILLLAAVQGAAQDFGDWDDPPQSWRDRIWFGGGLNVGFGTITAVQIDPVVGYKLDQKGRYSVGLGGSYWHFRDNTPGYQYRETGLGYRAFNRFRVIPPVFLHAEFLHLRVPVWSPTDRGFVNTWVPHLLVGGGYMQRISPGSSLYVQLLYEVMQDPNSVYRFWRGPILGGGVGIGF